MRFDTSQQMRLSQQMKLAPRMIQSMEILQMPMMALQERIDQELESNIALEQAEPGGEGGAAVEVDGPGVETDEQADDRLDRKELVVGDVAGSSKTDDWERLSALESTYPQAFDGDGEYPSAPYSPRRSSGERDKKMDAMANVAARAASLTDQLLDQWKFAEVDPEIHAVGARIIAYINSDGLLGADLQTILDQNRNIPGVELSLERLGRALHEVQTHLDPPGIGARDNRESFLLQIDALQAADAVHVDSSEQWNDVRTLIRDHYDDLLQNRLPRIVQKTQMSMERIHAAMELMKRLKLSPGRDLVDIEVPPIVPDVVVEYDEQADAYVAALSDGFLPTLRISDRYQQMAKDRSVDTATRDFVSNNVRNAQWLIESINQRKNTLLRVVNVVLARQRDYFDHGPQHLKPLPMIEVADQLGIHVGTVSRAVSDKWMQTPRGLVALRKFFSGGTETQSGQSMSWDAVKAILREIVDAEDRAKPLSDEALVMELKKRGIDIARRTVVKYRQQLDIPPARRRKVH
ncbi:MAG: RNA polymerase factor sigma-54 [Phycisphaerales bacterium]|nr:RNA polymerase factor sigma-54 [Phycisphaerales bacterium]MCI0630336.1 RNA polymerase factor sigma-54 [Phycisphaerales bacterium]MCI0676220.1 RNA polymerase factor sigma-54 [Phycisphaerales bacterium]